MEFCLTEFRFRSFPLSKFLKVPFPFVSVKTNFESSVKIPFPLMALCFRVNPYPMGKTDFISVPHDGGLNRKATW